MRYALAASFPEQADTDISVEEIARRINEELVATWGNLVNRVLSMVAKNFGEQPSVAGRTAEDDNGLDVVDNALVTASGQLERVELKAALRTAMDAAKPNAYLNATEPWKIAKEDLDRAGVVLGTALDAINGVRVAFAPYLPLAVPLSMTCWSAGRVAPPTVPTGTPIAKPTPLFTKVDLETLLGDDAGPMADRPALSPAWNRRCRAGGGSSIGGRQPDGDRRLSSRAVAADGGDCPRTRWGLRNRRAPATPARGRRDRGNSTPQVVAVGEAGLDYHYDHSPRAAQRDVFAAQIRMANQRSIPLVIHSRSAWTRRLRSSTVREHRQNGVPLLHRRARRSSGMSRCRDARVLFRHHHVPERTGPSRRSDRPARPTVCRDRLALPRSCPEPGKTNQPGWVPLVGQAVAEAKGVSVADVEATTWATAERFYDLDAVDELLGARNG